MEGNDIKRILMTADTVGGVWTYSMVLARQLAGWNIEVCLVTLGKKMSAGQKKEVAAIPRLRVFESDYKLEWMEDPWEDLEKAGRWLLQLEEELQPDLVHLNSYAFAPLPWVTPVLLVCHSCVFTWWQQVKGEMPDDKWSRYYEIVKQSLRTTDKLVAVSHTYALEMAHCYDIPLNHIQVIYNGLYPTDYSVREKKDVVFGMGRIWDEGKNYRIAEETVSELAWPVVLAGHSPDPWKSALQGNKEPEAAGANRITYTGVLNKEEVVRQLGEASIFILPSRYEPFGLSALEAGLSRCALVLSDIPTLREIWQEAALYAPPDDAAMWAEQINRLIADEPLRKYMAQKAWETALQFTSRKMASQYLVLYKELLHSNILSV